MIVKNESHIIESTLKMLSKYIDYWVISDTGSNDNTIEIIKNYFKSVDIPGELFEDSWEDFGTNRTKALMHAHNKCDYIWVFDADDIINGSLSFQDCLDADAYYMTFGSSFSYKRLQLFKSNLKWIYKGILHEYPVCLSKKNTNLLTLQGDYYIDSRRIGHRNKDPDKYLKDAIVLINGIEKDPENKTRYLFYIGQSYKDYGNLEEAIIWYKKRIDEKGWLEEVFYSHLEIALCLEKLNKPMDDIIREYMNAHLVIYDRREPLYYLGVYLKNCAIKTDNLDEKQRLFERSYNYLNHALNIKNSSRYVLFIHWDIYEWKNKFELAVVAKFLNKKEESINLCTELLKNSKVRENLYIIELIKNLTIYEQFINNNYIFLPNKDSFSNNITFLPNKTIKEMFTIADSLDNCIAFNTYGFFKNKINSNYVNLPNKYNFIDGIYINKIKIHQEIICLNSSQEFIKNQLDKLELKYNLLNYKNDINLYSDSTNSNLIDNTILDSFLLNKQLLENLINENIKYYYIILEDNITLNSNFKKYLNQIQEKLHKIDFWDILFISRCTDTTIVNNLEIFNNDSNKNKDVYGYIISKQCAKKILNAIDTGSLNTVINLIPLLTYLIII
jgi:hypothetical protein